LPTHGIGHLITEWDEEYEKPVGTPVSEERVNNCFQSDVHVTIDECKKLYDNFDDLPEEVQLILCNMMFNMGRPRLSKFLKLNDAIANENWLEASIQMEDSRWHKQVTNRANRLIKRMEAIGVTEQIAV
jgi:lysozyme